MKTGTIIIIASIVWSIISGIIAKRQAAAKKLAAEKSLSIGDESTTEIWEADPAQVRVESLRRRKRSLAPPAAPTPLVKAKRGKKIQGIVSLHKTDCPLPKSEVVTRHNRKAAKQIAGLLANRRNLRTAIVLNEILSKPISSRG